MRNLIPVTYEAFGNKKWRKVPNYLFASKDALHEISIAELTTALKSLPLGFYKADDGFMLAALQGLESGFNLLVGEDGQWLSSFFPADYKVYPFSSYRHETEADAVNVVCIDENSGLIVDEIAAKNLPSEIEVESFFLGSKEPTELIRKIIQVLQGHSAALQATRAACNALEEMDLFEPWNIRVRKEETVDSLTGLYRVKESSLNELSAESLLTLRDSGALIVAYAQLFSMSNLQVLQRLYMERKPASDQSEVLLENDQSGILNFDNI